MARAFSNMYFPGYCEPQLAVLPAMFDLGWKLMHEYGDGVVKLRRGDLQVFLRMNGSCGPVHTHDSMMAEMELHEAGVKIRRSEAIEADC